LVKGAVACPLTLPTVLVAAFLVCGVHPAVAAPSASPDTSLVQARERLARGEASTALQLIEQALQSEPANAQLLFLQGVALMDLGRDPSALAVFERLHERYPELPEPLNNIGLLQARSGRLESARQSLLQALRADPQHRAARSNLGQVYLMLAVQAWEAATADAAPDAALLRRLEAARALLAQAGR
jgi:Flp pilus assembly protein TadD